MEKVNNVQTEATGFNTLKDYIADYQQKGMKSTALNQLIMVGVNNKDNEDGTKISFRDKRLNGIYHDVLKKYGSIVSVSDLQNWFINGLYERVFANADLGYEAGQIANWASKELNGYIKRQIDTKVEDVDMVISESYTVDGEELSHYDTIADGEDDEFHIDPKFEKYIESLGGMEKVLTSRQWKIYNLSNVEGATHQSIADEIGVTKQAVTKAINTAKNKVKKEYLNWKIMNQLHSNRGLYDAVKDYLDNYAKIATFDVSDSFDYFNYTVQYFKENVSDNEEDITDVLMDGASKANRTLLIGVLNNKVYEDYDGVTFTKRQQDQFVMGTVRAFKSYVETVSKSVESFSDNVVHLADNSDGYAQVANLF